MIRLTVVASISLTLSWGALANASLAISAETATPCTTGMGAGAMVAALGLPAGTATTGTGAGCGPCTWIVCPPCTPAGTEIDESWPATFAWN